MYSDSTILILGWLFGFGRLERGTVGQSNLRICWKGNFRWRRSAWFLARWPQTNWFSLPSQHRPCSSWQRFWKGKASKLPAREKVEERLLPTLKMNWCIWPFIQAVNLSVVPPPWRILVINAACIPWLAFVSWMANKRTEHGTAATGSITWPEPSWTKLSTGRIQEAVV